MPALLRPARAGHDAVGAELVAPDHDADVGLERRGPHRRIAHRVVALETGRDLVPRCLVACQGKSELWFAGGLRLFDEFGQAMQLAGATDDVHEGRTANDLFLVL